MKWILIYWIIVSPGYVTTSNIVFNNEKACQDVQNAMAHLKSSHVTNGDFQSLCVPQGDN